MHSMMLFGCVLQAFEVVTRPALDSPEAALDRVKMAIYLRFADGQEETWPLRVEGRVLQLGGASYTR